MSPRQIPGTGIGRAVAQPPPILETDFSNPDPSPVVDTTDVHWPARHVGCSTFPKGEQPEWEWVPVLHPGREWEDTEIVGVSGTAVSPHISEHDVPFTHPFVSPATEPGFDFVFGVIPDRQYNNLLAVTNLDLSSLANAYQQDGDAGEGITHARYDLKLNPASIGGTLVVESDEALLPDAPVGLAPVAGVTFRPQDGDRVAVFGRWIVDAGHPFFQTEIHPPLAVVAARPTSYDGGSKDDATLVTLISRPYLVGQVFDKYRRDDPNFHPRALRQYFMDELNAAAERGDKSMDMKVMIYPAFSASASITFLVRPPTPRHKRADVLKLSYHFTTQPGVRVEVARPQNDLIRVTVVFESPGIPQLPPPIALSNYRYVLKDILKQLSPDDQAALVQQIYNLLGQNVDLGSSLQAAVTVAGTGALPLIGGLIGAAATSPEMNAKYIIEQGGVLMDYYAAPLPASDVDNDLNNTVTDLDVASIGQQTFAYSSIDNSRFQVFPVYGWMLLRWERH